MGWTLYAGEHVRRELVCTREHRRNILVTSDWVRKKETGLCMQPAQSVEFRRESAR